MSSVCYGVSNYLGPLISRDMPMFAVLMAGQVVALVVATLMAVVASPGFLSGIAVLAALGAGFGNAIGLYGFYRAAREGPLSIVAPIGALGTIVPVIAGIAGGEQVTVTRGLGIVLALGGVALASRRPGGAPVSETGHPVAWAVIAGLGFGVFLTLIDPAADSDPLWTVSMSRVGLLGLLLVIVLATRAPIAVGARSLPRVALPGLLLFSGTLALAAATRLGDLTVVSVVVSTTPSSPSASRSSCSTSA